MIHDSSKSVPDLISLTNSASSISSYLKGGKINFSLAEQEANKLYQEGIKLVISEVNKKPIIDEIVSPVVITLSENFSSTLTLTQHVFTLHRHLSKAYRIFIELTWHQCSRHGVPTMNETRDDIIENSKGILRILPKEEVGARFEYRCAKQAAKCLTPVESIWKKLFEHSLSIGEAAQGISPFGIIKNGIELSKDVRKEWPAEWYFYIHDLRWLSANIRTEGDFKNIIEKKIENLQGKGKQYTICLALIFVDLIKNSEVTNKVRELASKGLADLFVLRDRDRVSKLTKFALKKYPNFEFLQNIVKKADRYWETRSLIMQSLEELAKNADYEEYSNEIVGSLVKIQSETIHIEEQSTIQESLKVLKEKNKRLQEAIEEEELILATIKRDKQQKRSSIQTPFIAHDMANLQLEEFEASPINLSDFMIG
ncbi:hypothetical protein, partial [Candidatus Protochlamydia sp. R18]|uniref:hypothetical protein n=1 Tax=Candidatus Protochlamydia sp. R18 TaxID=1353977 RepID=UPI0011DCB206